MHWPVSVKAIRWDTSFETYFETPNIILFYCNGEFLQKKNVSGKDLTLTIFLLKDKLNSSAFDEILQISEKEKENSSTTLYSWLHNQKLSYSAKEFVLKDPIRSIILSKNDRFTFVLSPQTIFTVYVRYEVYPWETANGVSIEEVKRTMPLFDCSLKKIKNWKLISFSQISSHGICIEFSYKIILDESKELITMMSSDSEKPSIIPLNNLAIIPGLIILFALIQNSFAWISFDHLVHRNPLYVIEQSSSFYYHNLLKIGFANELRDISLVNGLFGDLVRRTPFDRYIEMLPYEHNRIILASVEQPHLQHTLDSYINASPVQINERLKFICTQGPTSNSISKFWRMILETRAETIIMLTNLVDDRREKCSKYWPDAEGLTVRMYIEKKPMLLEVLKTSEEQIAANTIVRKFSLIVRNLDGLIVKQLQPWQLHISNWVDHTGLDLKSLDSSLSWTYQRVSKIFSESPVVVHCSAGVGRSGTFVVAYLLRLFVLQVISIPSNYIPGHDLVTFFVELVRDYRERLVETEPQLKLLYDYFQMLQTKHSV